VIDLDVALEHVLSSGDEWQSWRALRLSGDDPGPLPTITEQDGEGGFLGPTGSRPSPGATGQALCHFVVLKLDVSGPATIAADWLMEVRTPAEAWLDPPDDVPGDLDDPAGGRVWATAAATCGLLAVARDPGPRAVDLLRGEADHSGHFTGGAYPTFAAAGTYWLAEGPKTEMTEWALRWARERLDDDVLGPWDIADALTFWGAARIPLEHMSVDLYLEALRVAAPEEGWPDDLELTLRTLEVLAFYEA
jgi:hypothetical protein